MGFLDRMQPGALTRNDFVSRRPFYDTRSGLGLGGHVVETGEYLGVSYFAGWFNTKHADKSWARIRGVETTYVGGIVLKAIAVFADLLGYGDGWASHLSTAGTAMIGTHLAALGAAHGSESKEIASAPPAKQLPPKKTTTTGIGHIPQAPEPNKWLDLNKVSRVAAMHGG